MSDDLLMSLKVLYVEDDDDTREELVYFLKKRVGKLFVAKDGKEGYEKFLELTPDIIITDSRMPHMNGIEMSAKIREKNEDAGIIVTTAFSDVETVLKAIDMGIDKYILKPIDAEELLLAMKDSAYKLARKRDTSIVLGEYLMTDMDEKKEMEKEIQNQVAQFLKNKVGKGPKFVRAFIKSKLIEIEAHDTITKYESALLENRKNERLVSFVRESFYMNFKGDLEDIVQNIIKTSCKLESTDINLAMNKDQLVFRIE